MNEDPLALLPELVLLLGAAGVLLLGSFLPRQRQWIARVVTAALLTSSAVAAAVALAGPDRLVFDGTFAVDELTATARLVAALSGLLVLDILSEDIAGDRRESEQYVLLLLATLGSQVLAASSDLIVLGVAYLGPRRRAGDAGRCGGAADDGAEGRRPARRLPDARRRSC